MELNAKSLIIAGLCLTLTLLSSLSQAETRYVTDVVVLRLRDEKGSDQNSQGVVTSGQAVDVIKLEDQWAHVRVVDGREGWVLKRYLIPQKTNALKLKNLQAQHNALKDQLTGALDENKRLTQENKRLRLQQDQLETRLKEVNASYENLKTEAAGYLDLKKKFENMTARIAEQAHKSEEYKAEIERLETRQIVRWFLSGAGVLFFGFIIGFASKRQRRRTSLR
jgi:SH3 domain protein